jgi:hypothetical protein
VANVATAPGPECNPKLDIDLQVWSDVPDGVETYEAIMESANNKTGAVEVPSLSAVTAGTNVWFTYTVANAGKVPLRRVQVTDSYLDVCVIELVPVGKTAGCARPLTLG